MARVHILACPLRPPAADEAGDRRGHHSFPSDDGQPQRTDALLRPQEENHLATGALRLQDRAGDPVPRLHAASYWVDRYDRAGLLVVDDSEEISLLPGKQRDEPAHLQVDDAERTHAAHVHELDGR